MAITDELREWWVRKFPIMDKELHEDFTTIADRIDAAHAALAAKSDRQREQLAAMEDALRRRNEGELKRRWQREIDALRDERDELREAVRLSEAKASGMIELPKDADGEYVHIGDAMEWMPRDKTYQTVIRVVSGVGADVFFAWSGKSCQYAQYDAQAFRHYRQPTIEEVLTEFGIDWEHEDNCEDRAALLAEYAKRLKLAGEGE